MVYTKVPPHSIEAEMAVLGAMLIEKEVIDTVSELVQAKHFYSDIHRKIFEAITDLYNRNQPVDIVTLTDELKKNNRLDELGGQKYLADLLEKVSTSAHTQAYAQLVKEKALLRDLIRVSTSVIEKSFIAEDEVENILDYAQEQILEVAQTNTDHGFISADVLAPEVLHRIEKFHLEQTSITGVPTGFYRFDEMTCGLQPSDLVILAARPSQGKTALALNIAYHASVEKKLPVAIFSLEMDKHAIFQRLLCSAARANLGQARRGQFPREIWTDLTRFSSDIAVAPLWIDDTPGLNILDIRARTRKLISQLKAQNKTLSLIIIDYLQLIRGTGRLENRQQEVSEISRLLKDLARSLKLPVLALSQLNRRSEDKAREGNRPQLSDLRESGSLEQDADVVALIHREWKKDDPNPEIQAKLIIAKQRNGPVGDIELNFFSKYTRFENPAMPGTEPIAEEAAVL
ncbi:MAG: replicative DNA helicase [Elusimicrobia bacterium]|nr:replicative DNA helicase [Elusimicrobiota bacterium]